MDVEEAAGALAGAVDDSDDSLVEVLEDALLDEFAEWKGSYVRSSSLRLFT